MVGFLSNRVLAGRHCLFYALLIRMTVQELNKWCFEQSLMDEWWVSVNGSCFEQPVSMLKIRELVDSGNSVLVLHSSQAELDPAPWVSVEASFSAPPPLPVQEESGEIEWGAAPYMILAFLLFLGGLWLVMKALPDPGPSLDEIHEAERKAEERERSSASVMAREFIKKDLKSPSGAKFNRLEITVLEKGDGEYVVSGEVDAPNSFGVMLRRAYVIRIKKGEGDQWIRLSGGLVE